MAFLHRSFLLLFLHISLLNCSVVAKVLLNVPKTVEVYKGNTAVIPCQYTLTETEPTFVDITVLVISNGTWTRIYYTRDNEEMVVPGTDYTNRIEVISEGRHRFQLIIKDVQLSDERNFRFQINGGSAGNVENTTSLKVSDRMVKMWKESPQGLVKEGDTVELRCQGDDNHLPSFTFTREQEQNVVLPSSGDTLILSSVSRKDSDIYQCRLLLTDGVTRVKGEVELTVHYLDPVVVEPEAQVVFKGESLTATCNALSSLPTSTVWYKDGKQVGQGNTLHLQDVTSEDNGEYMCEVTVPALPTLHTKGSVRITVQVSSTTTASFTLDNWMIWVTILSLVLLSVLGGVIYLLYKKGKILCGRAGKHVVTKDDTDVEMKPKNEESVLLQTVSGDQQNLERPLEAAVFTATPRPNVEFRRELMKKTKLGFMVGGAKFT